MRLAHLLLASSLACAGGACLAQEVRIAVVDMQRLERDSPRGEQAVQQLRKDFEARGRDINSAQQRLKEARDRFDQSAASMGQAQRQKAENDLMQQAQRLEQQQRAFNEDLELRKNQLRNDLNRELVAIIKSIAEADKFDLVLADMVAASKNIDITDRVLQELAKRAKSGAAAPAGK